MQLARFVWQGSARWGVVRGGDVHDLEGRLWGEMSVGARVCALDQVRLLAPLEPTNKVIGLGLTYKRMYAWFERTQGPSHRDGPAVFIKPPNTHIAHLEPIVYHEVCTRVIYEAEVGVVIGKTASRVGVAEALDYVGGYTCLNDVTSQGFTTVEKPIVSTRFKICDTFCPIGPVVETDLDPEDITVLCRVNGVEVQRSNTGDAMCYSFAEMIAWVTSFMTLNPGDIIATGSNGTGPLRVGDTVEVEIPGLGILSNPVVAPA
ncbi:MAG: fumarylacetoacetate hydrolase family protein [Chloroflexota bacterium]